MSWILVLLLPLWISPPLIAYEWSELLGLWLGVLWLHELAHWSCWRLLGYRVRLDLRWPASRTEPSRSVRRGWHQIVATVTGPAANLTCAALSAHLYPDEPSTLWRNLNMLWGLCHLLPIAPFDGSLLLQQLGLSLGGARGVRIAYALSALCSLLLCFITLALNTLLGWSPAIVSFLLLNNAWEQFQTHLEFGSADLDSKSEQLLHRAITLYQQGNCGAAQQQLKEWIAQGKEGKVAFEAKLTLAKWLLETGQREQAWQLVEQIPSSRLKGDASLLVHQIAYQNEQFARVRELSAKAFTQSCEMSVAVMNAVASARLHQQLERQLPKASSLSTRLLLRYRQSRLLHESLGWLEAAARLHFCHWSILDGSDFESLRYTYPFIELCHKLKSCRAS